MGSSESLPRVMPSPGAGRYGVGCIDLMVDNHGSDDVGILARIFYPTDDKAQSLTTEASTLPDWIPRLEYIDGLAAYKKKSPRNMRLIHNWLIGKRQVPATYRDKLATKDDTTSQFPVIIFSHGLSACRHFYSAYCTAIASHGYIIAAVEHRDQSACWTYTLEKDAQGNFHEKPIPMRHLQHGEKPYRMYNFQLHKRVSECVKAFQVLEELNSGLCGPATQSPSGSKIILEQDFNWSQFKGRLNLTQAAIVGHSFGGATAIASMALSSNFRAAVVLDGWMYPIEWDLYGKVDRPVLFLNAGNWQWADNVKRMLKYTATASNGLMLTFKNVVHQSFTDLTYPFMGSVGKMIGLQGKTDPLRCKEAAVLMTIAFLRKHFGLATIDSMPALVHQYEDFVQVGTTLNLNDTL